MKMSNKTYDFLNKFHRVILVLMELLGVPTVTVQALNQQDIRVPAVATTIIAVAQTVLGYMLHISSKAYWEQIGGESEGDNDGDGNNN